MQDINERHDYQEDESQERSILRKPYQPPRLRNYGTVSDLTQTSAAGARSDNPGRNSPRGRGNRTP